MKYIFIDTNVFLNFYSFNKDHLDKLDKIIDLIKGSKIKLILPRQVVDEFNRNRENKLKETLDYLKSFETKLNSPTTCHDFPEMKEIQKKINEIRELSTRFQKVLLNQIKSKELPADKIINEIISNSEIIKIPDDLLERAKRRFDLGNPPGKDNSYGDAVNWESCLEFVPEKEDLYFIAEDLDYSSDINRDELADFLKEEWRSIKQSKIFYYHLISKFLKDNFPNINISEREIKEEKEAVVESIYNKYFDLSKRCTIRPEFLKEMEEAQRMLVIRPEVLNQMEETRKIYAEWVKSPEFIKGFEETRKLLASRTKYFKELENIKSLKKKF